jgi:asparagine synthase (glutamine-hydrolysing)
MSGIAGVVFAEQLRQIDRNSLCGMGKALAFSPESSNVEIWKDGPVGLAVHCEAGRQAGVLERRRNGRKLSIAFFGSIYNAKEFVSQAASSRDLLAILLDLYETHSMNFIHRLRGEFTFAVWDGGSEALHVATDRFRVFPLLYFSDNEKLIFGSRMGALYASGFSSPFSVDPRAVVDFMQSSYIPTPKTIFKEVLKMPPGSILTYRQGKATVESYWDMNYLDPLRASEEELAQELKRQLKDAIAIRFQGEVSQQNCGTFLSGGIDSSTVTGVLAHLSNTSIKSFSIGFSEERFNEMAYARGAARAFSSDLHEYFVTAQDTIDVISMLVNVFDEPYANASSVPLYYCAKLAKSKGVNVLYAGDGGDELFAGNDRYAALRIFEHYDRVPAALRNTFVRPLVSFLADSLGTVLFQKAKKYILRASIPYPDRLCSYGFLKTVPPHELFSDDLMEMVGPHYDPDADLKRHYFAARAQAELDRQMYIDLKLAIADNDLIKVTRMAEQAGVVVRFPFLDHCLAEFSSTVPVGVLMDGRELRSFFKRAYSDMLPRETLEKEKHGFGLPIPVWLRTNKTLNELMHDLVLSPRSVQRGYFRKSGLETILERHQSDKTSYYGAAIWNLMMLELWHRKYVDAGIAEGL